jgi:hypothetical protein
MSDSEEDISPAELLEQQIKLLQLRVNKFKNKPENEKNKTEKRYEINLRHFREALEILQNGSISKSGINRIKEKTVTISEGNNKERTLYKDIPVTLSPRRKSKTLSKRGGRRRYTLKNKNKKLNR